MALFDILTVMANPEHLARLKEGACAWHQWRAEAKTISPDLRYGDLRGADLHEMYLGGAIALRPGQAAGARLPRGFR